MYKISWNEWVESVKIECSKDFKELIACQQYKDYALIPAGCFNIKIERINKSG